MDHDPERSDTVPVSPILDRAMDHAFQDHRQSANPGESAGSHSISLLEETAVFSKRRIVTGSVKIETRTELRRESADLVLDRQVVDVTRVAVNRLIEKAPEVRTEGDTTIVPVVEERSVVVKQLFLTEELHIRHRTQRETLQHCVELRRQSAVIQRLDVSGRIIAQGDEPAPRSAAPATNGP